MGTPTDIAAAADIPAILPISGIEANAVPDFAAAIAAAFFGDTVL